MENFTRIKYACSPLFKMEKRRLGQRREIQQKWRGVLASAQRQVAEIETTLDELTTVQRYCDKHDMTLPPEFTVRLESARVQLAKARKWCTQMTVTARAAQRCQCGITACQGHQPRQRHT